MVQNLTSLDRVNIHICAQSSIPWYTHRQTHTHKHTTHTHTHVHAGACVRACVHIWTHTQTHTDRHRHTHTTIIHCKNISSLNNAPQPYNKKFTTTDNARYCTHPITRCKIFQLNIMLPSPVTENSQLQTMPDTTLMYLITHRKNTSSLK